MSDKPDDNDHYREVYAHFGLAMYLAQCLEHGLVNALIHLELLPHELGRARATQRHDQAAFEERYDAFMDNRFKEVIGSLVQRINSKTQVENELGRILVHAKDQRNFLAHHFYRERSEAFISRKGRDAMIEELRDAQSMFERADTMLSSSLADLPTVLVAEQHAKNYIEDAYRRASERDV